MAIHAEFEINVNRRHPVTLNVMQQQGVAILVMVIADTSLVARRGEAQREVMIRVHQPEPTKESEDDTTYQTLVEIDGFEQARQIFGDGSLQSLGLAFGFIRIHLDAISSQGWVLFSPGDDEQLDPHLNLFGSWPK